MSIPDKIKKIEEEMSRTQINKATERHLGVLKARMAKLRREEEERILRSKGGPGDGYTIPKDGDATVVLLGLPSVGKSTLINSLTNAKSKVAAYDFTTLTVVPGIMTYKGAKIQMLDIPGIIKDASKGKGLGKRILSTTRSADLILVIIEVYNPGMRELLLDELRAISIRPDEKPPNITVNKRASGGIHITDLVGMTHMEPDGVKDILREYRYHNSHIIIREDITYDQLIDVLVGNRVYMPTLTLLNKVDLTTPDKVEEIRRQLGVEVLPISADKDTNLDVLREMIFEKLHLMRLYLKPKGEAPDYEEPLIARDGSTIREIADKIHGDLKDDIKFTRIWGKSAKYDGQKVGLDHKPFDEDVLTFYTK